MAPADKVVRLVLDGAAVAAPAPSLSPEIDCWDESNSTFFNAFASVDGHTFSASGPPGGGALGVANIGGGFFNVAHYGGAADYTASSGCRYKISFMTWQLEGEIQVGEDTYGCVHYVQQPYVTLPYQGCKVNYAAVHFTVTPNYQPVTVQLNGPTEITAAGEYTWTAAIQGGTGGTLSWSGQLCKSAGYCLVLPVVCGNQGTSCSLNIEAGDESFEIGVSVSDGTTSDNDSKSVTVNVVEPLEVAITGPSTVNVSETCTWFASVSGGTPPYSYSWSGVASGTGSSLTASLSSSGTVYLTVADSGSGNESTSLAVTVDQSSSQDPCFN